MLNNPHHPYYSVYLSWEARKRRLFNSPCEWRLVDDWPGYFVSDTGRIRKGGISPDGWDIAVGVNAATGYPTVALADGKRRTSAGIHRLIAMAFIRNPDGLPQVRHLDGDRANCALDNLAWGTELQNSADRFQKNYRTPPPMVKKLSAETFAAILSAKGGGVFTDQDTAKFYNCDIFAVRGIWEGRYLTAESVGETRYRKRPNAKLTCDSAREIMDKAREGWKRKDLAAEHGVSVSAIDKVVNRENWR